MRKCESAAAKSCRPKVTKTDGYLDGRRTAQGAIRNGAVHMQLVHTLQITILDNFWKVLSKKRSGKIE